MIYVGLLTSIVVCLGLTAHCQDTGTEIHVPRSPYPVSEDAFSVSTIAEGFSIPYGIAIVGDNEYFITDRIGKMFHFKDGSLTEISGVPAVGVVKFGEVMLFGGLMDLSIHPEYSSNNWVYVTYVSNDYLAKVARCKIQNDSIAQFEIIFTTQNQNIFGNGMRMVWEDDTHFFLNVGSSNWSTSTHPILVSQDLHSGAGKIHRLMEDGSIPSDNPIFDGFTSPSTFGVMVIETCKDYIMINQRINCLALNMGLWEEMN